MPIYEYRCIKCGHVVEKVINFHDKNKVFNCDKCGGWTVKVPSIPGFRRDHTLVEK